MLKCYIQNCDMRVTDLPDMVKTSRWTALHAGCSFTSQGDQLATIKACAVFAVNNGSIPATCTKRVLKDHCSWIVLEDKLCWFNLNSNQVLTPLSRRSQCMDSDRPTFFLSVPFQKKKTYAETLNVQGIL